MAIDFDNVAHTKYDGSVSSINWPHTVGSGTNRLLLIAIAFAPTTVSVSSVTVGSQSATFLRADSNSTWARGEIWYLLNPTSGSQTITVNFSNNVSGCACGSCSYSGVAQTGTFDTSAAKTAFSATPNVDITLAGSSECVFIHSCWIANRTVSSHDSGQTHRYYEWSGNTYNVSCDGDDKSESSSGAKNYQITISSTWFWVCQAVAFNPSPAHLLTVNSTPVQGIPFLIENLS